jgi:hypothetical protein
MNLQPYQEASQELKKQSTKPGSLLKQGAAIAGGITSGASILGRIAPLLSSYIPQDLAIKGLNKVDSRLGKFIEGAMESGKTFDEVKNFMGEKVNEGQQSAKEDRNIIQQYAPHLYQYISDLIKNGASPIQAAAKARKFLDKKDQKIIDKMEKDHKTDWSSIVESVFGKGNMAQQNMESQQPQQGQANPQAKDQLLKAMHALSQQLIS